jgi:hypothetical protein
MGVAKKTRKFAAVKRVIGMVFGGSKIIAHSRIPQASAMPA